MEYVISGGKNYELPQNILFLTLSVITEKDVSSTAKLFFFIILSLTYSELAKKLGGFNYS